MIKCQVCQQEKDASEFTNRDAMSHICDTCYAANEADYYASMADPNKDAEEYLAQFGDPDDDEAQR